MGTDHHSRQMKSKNVVCPRLRYSAGSFIPGEVCFESKADIRSGAVLRYILTGLTARLASETNVRSSTETGLGWQRFSTYCIPAKRMLLIVRLRTFSIFWLRLGASFNAFCHLREFSSPSHSSWPSRRIQMLGFIGNV